MISKPSWIRTKWPEPQKFSYISGILQKYNVNTVCRSARCPNIGECFSFNHLTFLILGDICTRKCRFCSVKKGIPVMPSVDEVDNIVKVVEILNLSYVIVTSVTRDDLSDGGAGIFADVIIKLKHKNSKIKIEILTPDFLGEAADIIIKAKPYIWAHNIETVPELYREVRPEADFKRSLDLLISIKLKDSCIETKSGIMLGLGEEEGQVLDVFAQLKNASVDIITIGQYLKPDPNSVDVKKYLSIAEFNWYKEKAEEIGFKKVICGPLVRSSYRGKELNSV